MEVWKSVLYNGEDFSEWLEVSNLGRIRNPKTGNIRKQNVLKTGYYFVSFSMGSRSKKKTIRVHKAIAEAFIENKNNKPIINHIDGDKLNNNIENLEWATYSENSKHAVGAGLTTYKTGCNSHISKLDFDDVEFIRRNYKPRDGQFGARALGRKYGINHCNILRVVKNKTYKQNIILGGNQMMQEGVLDIISLKPEQVGYIGTMIYNEILDVKDSDMSDEVKKVVLGILNPINASLNKIIKSYEEA